MKLLYTIQELIKEAEDNLYNASLSGEDISEIEKLQEKVDDSLNLLEIYKNLM